MKNNKEKTAPPRKTANHLYLWVSGFVPKFLMESWGKLIMYGALELVVEEFSGFVMTNAFLLGIAAMVVSIAFRYGPLINLGAFVFGFLITVFLIDLMLKMIADTRAHICEDVFPDMLVLMSTNIRAGMTPESALEYSIRDEFGPLSDELKWASKKARTGTDMGMVLLQVADRIRSRLINGSLQLIVEGLRSGGELGALLEETARDIRNMDLIKAEVRAQVRTYSVFIFFAACLGAPALFSVSSYLVTALAKLNPVDISTLPPEAITNLPFMKISRPDYGPDFLRNYAMVNILIISIFSSMLIGLIEQGNEIRGIRYIPVLLIISLLAFFIVSSLVQRFSFIMGGWVG